MPAEERFPVTSFASLVHDGGSVSIPVLPTSAGRLGRIGNTELWRRDNGELELVRLPAQGQPHGVERDVYIQTGAQQQMAVRLPDSSYVRMDSGSKLAYRAERAAEAETVIGLEGQALVDVKLRPGKRPGRLLLETPNGELETREGEYAVLANRNDIRVTLLDGTVDGDFPIEGGQRTLKRKGDMVKYDRCCMDEGGGTQMVLSKVERTDPKQAVDWVAKSWRYEKVSVRVFAKDVLGQKYDQGIESVNCIPEHLTITAEIHFDDPVQVVYDLIQQAGVKFHEHDGMLSFCAPGYNPMDLAPPFRLQQPAQSQDVLERIRPRELLAIAPGGSGCCGLDAPAMK